MRFADFISQKNNIFPITDTNEQDFRKSTIEMILSIIKIINNSLVLEDVLNLVMINAIRIARAERGFLLLLDDSSNELRYKVGMNLNGEFLDETQFEISKSVVKDAFELGESICIENASSDVNFQSRVSIMNLELQTIICTPLIANNEKLGVIYVDSKQLSTLKKADTLHLFEVLAGHAAIAIKNAKLYQSLDNAFNELQTLHERLITSERIVLKKEINSQVGNEIQSLVHLALLENDSAMKKLQKIKTLIPPVYSDNMDDIIRKMQVALESIRKIQRYSQTLITSTHFELVKKTGDLNRTIRNVIDYLKKTNKFKLVSFEVNFDKLPLFEYDHEQIEQVIVNIFTNSVENKVDALIKIATYFDQENKQVIVKINDNGSGIPKEIQDILFYRRVTKQTEGRGYGLYLAKKIIDNHNGKIYCVSELEKGTTIYFSLPIN